MTLLPSSFYERECLEVAVDLLGKQLCLGEVTLRITEVEAYRAGGDTASHCRFGQTKRNAPMFGPPGHAYVYLCYGIHQMLNVVADPEHVGAAVLVRACEVRAGAELVIARRRAKSLDTALCAGPGKVGAALGIDVGLSGQALFQPGGLELHDAAPVRAFLAGPRVGIGFASDAHQVAPWRLAVADSDAVTERRSLRPVEAGKAAFLRAERRVSSPRSS
jgi:DNA-3-methyladenine glycosylase